MSQSPSKSERMELRRAIGNRKVPGPYVPPYHRGPEYLIAHACCALREMGRNFKAPKKRDIEPWKKAEALWSAGVRFWAYNLADPPPERLRDVAEYIGSRKRPRAT